MRCIKQLSASEIQLVTQKPVTPYIGYEVVLSSDISYVAKALASSEHTYVKGFRLPGLSSPNFEVSDIMKHFDYFFYVVHMAQLLGIKQHQQIYLVLTNSYSVNFFRSNIRLFNEFICNMITLNNSCNYVEFIVENAPISYVYENELILAQNAGAPSSSIVNLLQGAGLHNFREGLNAYNAMVVTNSIYAHDITFDYYLSESCNLIIMGDANIHLSRRLYENIRKLDISVSGVDNNFDEIVNMEGQHDYI